jgi:hypothetical protein
VLAIANEQRRLANVPCCLIGMEGCSGAHPNGCFNLFQTGVVSCGIASIVPIRALNPETAVVTRAFEAALRKLELVDRHDPAAIAIAKLIVIQAKKGEWDPSRLCNHVVTLWRNRWPPQLLH